MKKPLTLIALTALVGSACTGAIDGGTFPSDPAATPATGPEPSGGRAPSVPAGPPSAPPPSVPAEPPPPAGSCSPDRVAARVWRLTPEQYAHTIADLFGATLDASTLPRDRLDARTGFTNGADDLYISGPLATALLDQATVVAARVGAELAKTYPCLAGKAAPDACVRGFVGDLGRRMFRRPLEDEEVGRYLALYREIERAQEARAGAETVVTAMLMSPGFHYRTELGRTAQGARDAKLTAWEIASALSYGLADSPPGAELLAAAAQGTLADPAERRRHARLLAESDRGRRKMARFVYWQLQLHRLESMKDTLGAGVFDALVGEVDQFVRELMARPDGDLRALYTASHSYVDAITAKIYGLAQRPSSRTRVDLPPAQRFGIFTQPAWLTAAHAPIHRGHLLRDMFLCDVVPPPPVDPDDLVNTLPVTAKDATEAEKWDVFVKERPACAGCHGLFVPMGLAFESYDEEGRFRTATSAGKPIRTAGEVAGATGWSGRFTAARDLVEQLAASASGQACFARRYMTYVLGRELERDSCGVTDVAARFREGGLGLRTLVEAVGASGIFVERAVLP